MKKISVIIPVYNVEKFLRECLDSVINQTLKDIEIICVNDGSTDNSKNILEEYASKDNRIKVIHKENGGYGQAMNVGLDNAAGKYIGIVEPDDYIDTKMYEDLYNIAEKDNSDIVKSGFYDNLQSPNLKWCRKVLWEDDKIPQDRTFTIQECPLFLYYHPSVWSCIYKKEFLDKHNIKFVEAPGAGWTDNPFQVQTMCLAERITYTPNAYYYWRRLNENESEELKDWTIPFKRTDEINNWLTLNGINDENILSCLSAREMAYINIVLNKDLYTIGYDKVYREITKMSECMNLDFVLNSKWLNKTLKTEIRLLKEKGIEVYYKYFKKRQFKNRFKLLRKRLISIHFNKKEKYVTFLGHTFGQKSE